MAQSKFKLSNANIEKDSSKSTWKFIMKNNDDIIIYDKNLFNLLARAESLIWLMKNKMESDESQSAQILIEGAEEWLEEINKILENSENK